MKEYGAKSEEEFEFLYELVEDSETAVSQKSNKRQWKHIVTGDSCFNTYSRPIKKSEIQE